MYQSIVSSFAPLEYYKKLTNCLANSKNLKLNLSKIPKNEKKENPLVTIKSIQTEFLEKYNVKRNEQEQENQKIDTETAKQDIQIRKRKKYEEENLIYNLPDAYFKAHEKPNLAFFKVPQQKKQKINPSIHSISKNTTVASIFSSDFNPKRFSTLLEVPVEQKQQHQKPVIIDPRTIINLEIDKSIEDNEDSEVKINKLKEYEALTNECANQINSPCFDNTDPIKDIVNNLNQQYNSSTKTLREPLKAETSTTLPDISKFIIVLGSIITGF